MKGFLLFVLSPFLLVPAALAGKADVLEVDIRLYKGKAYHFTVTVQHADDGEKHHAKKWEILAPDGTLLATRVLGHPHDFEQPFTREHCCVPIPAGIDKVTVRAWDNLHGHGGKTVTVAVPR